VGGYGLDAVWADDVHHALHVVLTGEAGGYYADFGGLSTLCHALREPYVYAGDYSPHRDRIHGRMPHGVPGDRFVACLQNHDQIGNRAQGERISHLVRRSRSRVGAALLLTSPYVPLLFAGREWDASAPFGYFTSHESAELAEAVRQGRRNEFAAFGWDPDQIPDPQDPETFTASRLDWSELEREPHATMLAWYRALLRLRREEPALQDGRRDLVRATADEDAGWIRVERGPISLLANLGPDALVLPASGHLVLGSEPAVQLGADGLHLPPDSAAILRADR
ncbi:MAG: DUF3459 domain-containing protein, partial [Thermoleophilaceae bacterium]